MRFSRVLRAAVGAAAFSLAVSSAALADDDDDDDGPASDLVCDGCVGPGDIAADAVTGDKIAPGAVGFGTLDPVVVDAIEEGGALEPVTVSISCAADDGLQAALDAARPGQATTIVLLGDCNETVTVRKDDITIDGDPSGSGNPNVLTRVNGIRVEGAARLNMRNLDLRRSGPEAGFGLVATQGSQFVLSNSRVFGNDLGGIDVREGSTAVIENSTVESNGMSSAAFGGGIRVTDGSSARIQGNSITTNFGDGILVSNGAFARIEGNTVEFSGRGASNFEGFGEACIRVAAASVQASGNINRNPTNLNLIVEDGGLYRAGEILNRGMPDNPFGFEEITAGPAGFAVVVNQGSEAVLRQTNITGRVGVTFSSILTVAGDEEGPDLRQATLAGDVTAVVMSLVRVTNSVDFTGICEARGDSNCFTP